jgi:outer membrane protein OmpA-like peptidoglycan-associated protein
MGLNMTLRSIVLASICLAFGTVFAADHAGDVIELNGNIAPEVIENGLFPKSATANDCAEAAKAGFTCGQIVPRKVFSLPSGISFASGSAKLSEPAKKLLAGFGPILKRNESSGNKVVLVGHTDVTGSKTLNMRLSQLRAESVRQYFITNFGISPSFLSSVGVGSQQLKDPGEPASGVNRRVEISTRSTSP